MYTAYMYNYCMYKIGQNTLTNRSGNHRVPQYTICYVIHGP